MSILLGQAADAAPLLQSYPCRDNKGRLSLVFLHILALLRRKTNKILSLGLANIRAHIFCKYSFDNSSLTPYCF
jgi:hypothetical protein